MLQQLSKIGLVIGNADYERDNLGYSPLNDAKEISNILNEKGFMIIHKENFKSSEIEDIINEFVECIQEKSEVLFYYAGHAIQIGGGNWLLPIDNSFINSGEAMRQSLQLSSLLDKINQKDPNNIAIILGSRLGILDSGLVVILVLMGVVIIAVFLGRFFTGLGTPEQ